MDQINEIAIITKVCKSCKMEQDINEFQLCRYKAKPENRRMKCKKCSATTKKEYNQKYYPTIRKPYNDTINDYKKTIKGMMRIKID